MLKIAKNKISEEKWNIKFNKGDMRTTNIGPFDAVITIFNAIGHQTQPDFDVELTDQNSLILKRNI